MELLAPAGGPEQARLALHFGADALYLSGRRWGMRAGARNFGDDELAQTVAAAHAQGARVHVAANVLMYDGEAGELGQWLGFLEDVGVDAAIVADLGALELLRRCAPHVEPHLSTQASVTNALAADAYARMGVRRIVLAREMTLGQVAELRRRCTRELELEVFAHGALCMAYSGRCLLSAGLMGPGRSASRGACAQPCRWAWSLVEELDPSKTLELEQDARGSYLLSSNDLCLIEHLDDLRRAGVDAIKLEGRAKGSYYTACVTNAYRQVLDGGDVSVWREELDHVSHRPYSTGFLLGRPSQNPGRADYARDRTMVAIVRACRPCEGGRTVEDGSCDPLARRHAGASHPAAETGQREAHGPWLVTVECRNKAARGSVLEALSPGQPVRSLPLAYARLVSDGPSRRDDDPTAGLVRNGALYELESPFPLQQDDLLCLPA